MALRLRHPQTPEPLVFQEESSAHSQRTINGKWKIMGRLVGEADESEMEALDFNFSF